MSRKTTLKGLDPVKIEQGEHWLILEQPDPNHGRLDTITLSKAQTRALIRFLTPKPKKAKLVLRVGAKVKVNPDKFCYNPTNYGFVLDKVYTVARLDGEHVILDGDPRQWFAFKFKVVG